MSTEPLLIRQLSVQLLSIDGDTDCEEQQFNVDDDDSAPVVDGVVVTLANGTTIHFSSNLEEHVVEVSASDADGRYLGMWTVPS